jgi:hypothetical protein
MKQIFSIFIFLLLAYSSSAQNHVKDIAPLKCDTWGKPQWSSYHPVAAQNSLEISQQEFLTFDQEYDVSFISPQVDYVSYVNNIQIIRWQIRNTEKKYKVRITNVYDEIIYEAPTEQCGLIIFPDSLYDEEARYISLKVIPADDERPVFNRTSFSIKPLEEVSRKAILDELKACPTIDCKVNMLVKQNRLWDAMSVLELEKMKDPDNLALYSLYWDLARKARLEWAQLSRER